VAINVFQVTESSPDWSYYGPCKVKFVPFIVIQLQGCFVDFVMHGAGWLNVQTGVSRVIIEPYGDCFSGVKEAAISTISTEMKMDHKVSTIVHAIYSVLKEGFMLLVSERMFRVWP
jgi:hypothetical protein